MRKLYIVMAMTCSVDPDITNLLTAAPLQRRQETLVEDGVEEELLQVEDEGLLHEDEVVVGDAEGVVVGRTQLPLAGYSGHHLHLFYRGHLLACRRCTKINHRRNLKLVLIQHTKSQEEIFLSLTRKIFLCFKRVAEVSILRQQCLPHQCSHK